jgi:trans-aconitate methyltransferase
MTEFADKGTAGEAYEAFMGRWSRPVARAFVDWLRPEQSAHWLDVGCGTGALTAIVCQDCAPATIVGCDPSAAFVEKARRQLSDARASFVVGGVEDLPGRAGGFDAVVSGLVLNFLPDPDLAVASMRQRVRPAGIVAGYVWDCAGGMALLRTFWDEVVAIDPSADEMDEARRFPLCRPEALAALFGRAGLQQVETRALEIETHFDHFDDYWDPFLGGTGPAPAFVASLDADRREQLRQRIERRLPTAADGSIRLGARAWAVRGLAP